MSMNRYEFTAPEQTDIRSAAKLLYVSSAKYGGDWHSTLHTHHCTELFYVTGGTGQFLIEGNTYPVTTHDLVIINPGIEHTEVSLNAAPLKYIVLGVEGLELTLREGDDYRYCIVNFHDMRERILFCLNGMLREIELKTPGYETVCQDLLEILVISIMRQTDYAAAMVPVRKNAPRLCASVRRYIDEHFKENLNLEMLAKMTHVSKYYMVHAFSEEYGISPINYMISCRIEEAKQLLKNDDYALSMISRMLGFSSPSYFSQSFRKIAGMTPNEYRRSCREKS